MLYWSIMFLIVALITGFFGCSGIATASAGIAQVLFVLFLGLFIATLLLRIVQD